MKSAVIVFPGSNRDRDMIAALAKIGGAPPAIVWHKETALPQADLYVIVRGNEPWIEMQPGVQGVTQFADWKIYRLPIIP